MRNHYSWLNITGLIELAGSGPCPQEVAGIDTGGGIFSKTSFKQLFLGLEYGFFAPDKFCRRLR